MLLGIEAIGVRALSTGPGETAVAAVIAFLRFSDFGWISGAADDPAHTPWVPRVEVPIVVERFLPISAEEPRRLAAQIGEIVLNNADGQLDPIVDSYAIDGRRVLVRVGSPSFALADFLTIFDGTATGWRLADDGSVRVAIRDISWRLDLPANPQLYAGSGGLEGPADLKGKPKPLALGDLSNANVAPVLVDADKLIYQVHDGRVRSIAAVYDRGFPLTAGADVADITAAVVAEGQFQTQVSGGYFRLGSTPAGLITCDVLGDAELGYSHVATDLALRFVLQRTALTEADIDGSAFEALKNVQPAPIGLYIGTEPVSAAAVLDAILGGIAAWWGCGRDGRLTCGRLEAPSAKTIAAEFDDRNLFSCERVEAAALSPPAWRRRVAFERNYTVQATDIADAVTAARRQHLAEPFHVTTVSDAAILAARLQAQDPPPAPTLFTAAADAEAEAVRLFDLYSTERQVYRLRTKIGGYRLDLGQNVMVAWPRYGLAAGRPGVVVGLRIDGDRNETAITVMV